MSYWKININKMCKYSFLVPVYNVEQYLYKCLESLLNQTYPMGEYEIILVDDGSTDSSGLICDMYKSKYEKISVIHQHNKGLMQARRVGIEASNGNYLVFVDSDDYVTLDLLQTIDFYIESFEPDFLQYGYYRVENSEEKPVYLSSKEYTLYSQIEMLRVISNTDKYNGISGKVVKANVLKEHLEEIYKYNANVGEDKIQTAFLIKYSSKMLVIRPCLCYYFIRSDSVIHNITIGEIYDVIRIHSIVREVVEEIVTCSSNQDGVNEILYCYDVLALQGTMDYIFKYNTRFDKDKESKIREIHELVCDNMSFFLKYKDKTGLKKYNEIRYHLLMTKKYELLMFVDRILGKLKRVVK